MGCDIHLKVEVKMPDGWQELKRQFVVNGKVLEYEWFWERNYSVFAMLADVRNGSEIIPIHDFLGIKMRGLPSESKEEEFWDLHGRSHLYLNELMMLEDLKYWDNLRVVETGVTNLSGIDILGKDGDVYLTRSLPKSPCVRLSDQAHKVKVLQTYREVGWRLLFLINELKSLMEEYDMTDQMLENKEKFFVLGEPENDRTTNFSRRVRIVFGFDN